ncbi:cell death activator CIDE-A [Denticeps clupeoides]|uniref:CIDE-N domain-containing protein n=1 Tax=Denticeps clupeoides TaxID=299321 RepID=A0AAY4BY67_9TELE|nr:cell death activator CIDE-A-like [Denticeps clupeoides]
MRWTYSGVEYAKSMVPASVMRSVSSVQASLSQRILPTAQPRPFRVCTQNRCRRKGVVATSLEDLLEKTANAFLLTCQFLTLVLEEDGTVVDSEAFFQSLPTNTQFMVLEKGEMWTQNKVILPSFRHPKKTGIAKLSFDLYKLNPKDFFGCLTIKATLYEIYSLSYDFRCTRARNIFKSLFRYVTHLMRMTGQLLLCGSSFVLSYIGDDD